MAIEPKIMVYLKMYLGSEIFGNVLQNFHSIVPESYVTLLEYET